MLLDAPAPFSEALAKARARGLLPTSLSTADLRQLDQAVRDRSVFSARTTNAQYLQAIKDAAEDLLQGKINLAAGRARLIAMHQALGYNPETHFGDDPSIPPAEPGSLRDLSSERRMNLVLRTQESLCAGYGDWLQGQAPDAREQFPCWELVRVMPKMQERGDWPERWSAAGGQFFDGGRMIAAKDDPVWVELGSSANFDDALDNPYPPFAFGSGMGWIEVPRDEALALGVIDPEETPEPSARGLNDEVQVSADQFDAATLRTLLESLRQDLSIEERDGEIRLGRRTSANALLRRRTTGLLAAVDEMLAT